MLGWLQKFNIDSKAKLLDMWENVNALYLQDSFLRWFDPIRRKEAVKKVKAEWEDIIKE